MRRKEMIERNLDLQYHLMMELLRDPNAFDIPSDAEVIFLPQDDPDLREANLRLGKRREKTGRKVVYISTKLEPQTRTVLVPRLQVTHPPGNDLIG